jgi:hypothetical protein
MLQAEVGDRQRAAVINLVNIRVPEIRRKFSIS